MPNLSAARGVGHIVSDDTLPTGPAGVAEVADATDLKYSWLRSDGGLNPPEYPRRIAFERRKSVFFGAVYGP
jgi:hypothetical protein